MTAKQYEAISRPFSAPVPRRCIRILNTVISGLFYGMYPVLLLTQYPNGFLRCLLTAGVPFLLVSVFRKVCNRPRPYEKLSITPLIPREKAGQSFPSRHVFSAFAIAMCWLFCVPTVGVILLVLACLMAAIRVIGGVHFPLDVIVGAVIGIVSGLIGFCI